MLNTGEHAQTFISISVCISRLEQSMWGGGIGRSERVKKAKEAEGRDLSVGDGARYGVAAERFREATLAGEVQIHCVASELSEENELMPAGAEAIAASFVVAPEALRLIPWARGRALCEFVYRVGRSGDPAVDRQAQAMIGRGLFVDEAGFSAWLEKERARGKWPSQGRRKAKPIGRPGKGDLALGLIAHLVEDGHWTGANGIPQLRALMIDARLRRGFRDEDHDVPSDDTLARVVQRHWIETGDDRFKPPRRRRRRKVRLPQNSDGAQSPVSRTKARILME